MHTHHMHTGRSAEFTEKGMVLVQCTNSHDSYYLDMCDAMIAIIWTCVML